MSELSETPFEATGDQLRCTHCDSIITPGDQRCLMCGVELEESESLPELETTTNEETAVIPEVVESVMHERRAPVTFWLTAVFAIIIVVLGALVLRFQGSEVIVALAPSTTPIPPTLTLTPPWTPLPTETPAPTAVPTATAVPMATPTLAPPRPHTVVSGESLIGLSLRYRVSAASIAEANGIPPDSAVLVDQRLLIPWPTPTPPLVPVATIINGETVIADPTDCERYEVKTGDALFVIAVRYDVDFGLFLQVNRLTEESILQPGDTVCIPEIVYGGNLPPTSGPSPTPTVTSAPLGPHLLFPVANMVIEPPDGILTLQWAAVKTLADAEWYMVELVDLDDVDSLPKRGFTRDNSFQAPSYWRPQVNETHAMRWRVSIVQVTGQRSDGLPIYTYGGENSSPAFFSWLGAVPTATPRPSSTATTAS